MGLDANDVLLDKTGKIKARLVNYEPEEMDQTVSDDSPQLDQDKGNGDNSFKTKEPPPEGSSDDGSLGEIDAGTIDFTAIPPRGWLLGNTFCLQFLSSLISPGGIGKTALRIAQGLALATRRNLTGEYVFRRCRVLIVTAEDDLEELKRRVGAAMLHYGICREDVAGWLFLRAITGLGWKLAISERGEVRRKELAARIENSIINSKVDIVILDPFVKTHGVPENDNNAIDQVAGILADIAIRHNVAIDVPHHASKATTDPGDPNKARGASSFIDAGRLSYTLTAMSGVEAQMFGVSEEERRSLVRVDSAKVNLVPGSPTAKWFRLVSVDLGNATEEYPHGDNIQVAEPWTPPDMWKDLPIPVCCRIIDEIDAGLDKGERFSGASAAKGRAAWPIVRKHVDKLTATQARKVISTWVENGVLVEREYHSTTERKDRTGLFANPAKRPEARQ